MHLSKFCSGDIQSCWDPVTVDTQVTNVIKDKSEWPNAVKVFSAWDDVMDVVN